MTYQVNLKSWIAGIGWQYTTEIDTITEYISAENYIKACNENMDSTPWENPADGESFMVEIISEDGEQLSSAWIAE